jgi:hypothetical protein
MDGVFSDTISETDGVVTIHPNYNETTQENNLALIEVDSGLVIFDSGKNILNLSQVVLRLFPFPDYPDVAGVTFPDPSADFAATQGFIYGFGLTSATGKSHIFF